MWWLSAIKDDIVAVCGSIAVSIGLLIGLIKLLDWALSESQKGKIADHLTILWNWLDDNKRFLPLRRFQTSRVQMRIAFVLTLTQVLGVWIMWEVYFRDQLRAPSFIMFLELGLLAALLTFGYMRPWIEWMASEENVLLYAIRSTVVFAVLVILPLAFLFGLVIAGTVAESGFGLNVGWLGYLVYFLWAFSSSFVVLQVYFWGVTIIYACAIIVLLIIGPALRFILVRTIEYPKGPVAAVSALLTFVGAVVTKIASVG